MKHDSRSSSFTADASLGTEKLLSAQENLNISGHFSGHKTTQTR